ncbi:MAG: hypothetical protein ACLFTI_05650 [Anaerolineales bacterium]
MTTLEREKALLSTDLTNEDSESALAPAAKSFIPADFDFVDREQALAQLSPANLKASQSPYILIRTPAGYGKSYLLYRLLQLMQNQAAGAGEERWQCRYIDFSQQRREQITYIISEITGQSFHDERSVTINFVCDCITQKLAAPHAEGRCAVLLLFDSVEQLFESARQWLYSLLHELRVRTHVDFQEIITVRVIIAERNVESFWEGFKRAYPVSPPPLPLTLPPFDTAAIRTLVRQRAAAAQIELSEATVAKIAEEAAYLSGGHPKVIDGLLDELEAQTFAIGAVADYFECQCGALVRKYISFVVDDLLDSLDAFPRHLRRALRVLSIFRWVNANTVQALCEAELLPPNLDEVKLLGDLQQTHLFGAPSPQTPYYRDQQMRRILALDLAHRSEDDRALYQELNQLALDLYAAWLHRLPDPKLRRLSFIEWLYHALQAPALSDADLRAAFQRYLRSLEDAGAGDPANPPVTAWIEEQLQADPEIVYLVQHRWGADGLTTLRSWLPPRFRQHNAM